MTYYSRSRQKLWLKGETSGHFQYVKSLTIDCDLDTLLAKVDQVGAACHTGNPTCFFQPIVGSDNNEKSPVQVFEHVYQTIIDRKNNSKEGSYTNYLFEQGQDKNLKKIGEECNRHCDCLQKSKSGRIENGNGRFPLSCYGTDGGKRNYMGRYYKSVIAEIDSIAGIGA